MLKKRQENMLGTVKSIPKIENSDICSILILSKSKLRAMYPEITLITQIEKWKYKC